MPVFIVAQLKFMDRERYNRYLAKFADVFRKFDGKALAAAENPQVLEGEGGPDKIVILEFPSEAAAQKFHNDPEYIAIAADRKAGANGLVLQFKGIG